MIAKKAATTVLGFCLALSFAEGALAESSPARLSGLSHGRHLHLINSNPDDFDTSTSATASPAMTFHGGVVLGQLSVRLLYAGPSWSNQAFVADKIAGFDSFFAGFGGSSYAATAQEYSGSNGAVGPTIHYQGHGTPLATSLDGESMQDVATAACNEYAANAATMPNPGSELIMIVSDMKRPSGGKYCAYHSAATCDNGQMIQFGFVWNLDGDPSCTVQDAATGHSQGLASLVNVTAHEVQETRSDPHLDAWFDSSNNEIGDKCAWSFGATPVTLSNGSQWKLQGEWSNAAFNVGTGFPNASGQPGCIDHVAGTTSGAPPVTPSVAAPSSLTLTSTLRCPATAIGASASCTGSAVVMATGGAVVLGAQPVTVTGSATAFTVTGGTCTAKRTLAAGTSCSVGSVKFSPTTVGSQSATLVVAGAATSVATVVSGSGLPSQSQSKSKSGGAATLAVSTSALSCGTVAVGKAARCGGSGVQLTAVGGAVTLAAVPVALGDTHNFVLGPGTCTPGKVLAAGKSCSTGTVSFKPAGTGIKSTSLSISTSAGVQTVAVSGNATASATVRHGP